MKYALGKKIARDGAIKLKFADFFDASKLPTPPAVFGDYQAVGAFHNLSNDRYSNCVWAGAAHEHMLWTAMYGRKRSRFTVMDVLSDYSAVTGFDINKPETDQGTDMQQAASYRQKVGIRDSMNVRHKIDSYVAMKIGDVDELFLAMWLFGAVGIGLELPAAAMDQTDQGQAWSVPSSIRLIGGHYVPGVGRDANGNIVVVTWGKIQIMTPAFYRAFSDENCAYIDPEALNEKNLSPGGFDLEGLRVALQSLAAAKETTMAPSVGSVAVQGAQLNPEKLNLIISTMRQDLVKNAPMYSHMVSDPMLTELATQILSALDKYDAAPTI